MDDETKSDVCPNCQTKLERNLSVTAQYCVNKDCEMRANLINKTPAPFAVTLDLIAELTEELILLKAIRDTAKELIENDDIIWIDGGETFLENYEKLKHLVITE